MIEKGRYFYLLKPSDSGTLYHYQPTEIYSYAEKHVFHRNMDIVPSFLYEVTEGDLPFRKKAFRNLIDYPPAPAYRREANRIRISPVEYRFSGQSYLLFSSKNYQEQQPVARNGGDFRLSGEFLKVLLKNKEGQISLVQDGYSFFLEVFPPPAMFRYLQSSVREWNSFTLLSVKDVLHPEGGAQRLIEDLNRGLNLPVQRKKMSRLLDIIRAANAEDEEEILSALYFEDPPFFAEVTQRVFTDELIPYMDKRELASILMHAPDDVLAPLRVYSPEIQALYRGLVSKKRMEDILNSTFPLPEELPEKTPAWSFIEQDFRKRRERTIYIKSREAAFFSIQNREEFALSKNYTAHWVNSSLDFQIFRTKERKNALLTYIPLKILVVGAKTARAQFSFNRYHNVPPGYFELDVAFLRGEDIVAAGALDYNNELKENLAHPVYSSSEESP